MPVLLSPTKILSAGGADFEVAQLGQGPDLVCFHSLLTDHTVFDRIAPALARGRRVTLVNLPGFGASTPAGPGIEDYADRMAALLPALAAGRSADLLAMSFGGFVAIALAARHGALLGRLALVDTAAAFPEPAKIPLRAMAERALGEGMGAVVETALRRMFSERFIADNPEIVETQKAVLLRARPTCFATACRALADLDLRPVLPRITHPALVVVGALDVTTPPALARELAAGLPDASLVEIAGCAHCPPLERPGEFLKAVGPHLGVRS